jgi:hypothetical protein
MILACVDNDELPKNDPIRIKARDRPPTWEPKDSKKKVRERTQTREGKKREAKR